MALRFVLYGSLLTLLLAGPAASAVQQETSEDLAFLSGLWDTVRRGEHGAALRELEDYLLDYPKSARARTLVAEVYRRRGDYEKANQQAQLAGASAAEQGCLMAWCRTAFDLFRETGRHEEARAALERGLAEEPARAELLSRKILLLARTGHKDEAARLVRSLPAVPISLEGDPKALLEYCRAYGALRELEVANQAGVYAERLFRTAGDARQSEALVLLGDLYREGRIEDGIEAFRCYRDALAIDRRSVLAYVGRALTQFSRMRWDLADEPIDNALALNPRQPDALAVRARWLLYHRHFSEALDATEQGLAVNPVHRQLLACRAAALLFLRRDGVDAAFAKMLESDPKYAEGIALVGALVAHHYRFPEAIAYFRRAIEIDPGWAESYVGLGQSLANTSRFEEALEAFEEFRTRDPFAHKHKWANNMRKALRSLTRNVPIERPPFTFLVDPLESPVLVPVLAELYRERWADFVERYGIDPELPVLVEVFPRHDDFSARTVGFTGLGALGVCFGGNLALLSPRSELRGNFEYQSTAVHELAHVVSLVLSRQRVPRWLTEGMSVYEEKLYNPICDREMDLDLFNYYHGGEIIPVDELNRLFAGPKILFGYYQSGLLCEYIVGHHGQAALVKMLELYGEDRETPEVVQEALGIGHDELDRRFLEWLWETRLQAMKVQPIYTAEGRRNLQRRLYDSEEPAADLLVQLAWANHQAGRRVDRDDYLNQAFAKDAGNLSGLLLMGQRALEQKNKDRAREVFEDAVGRGAEEFFTFLALADLEIGRDKDKRLDYLVRAKACFPRYVGPHNPYVLRASLLKIMDREDEALEEYRQYCAINEEDPIPRRILAVRALEREDYEESARYFRELLAIDPFVREHHRSLARSLVGLARPTEAIRALELALAVDPETELDYNPELPEEVRLEAERQERAAILLDLAEIYVDLGEAEKAAQKLRESRSFVPDSPRATALEQRLSGKSHPPE